jgi:outer membrane protein assembly factor BamC
MQTIGVRPEGAMARLEREGTQRWLVVQAPPEQVWDILRDYLQRNKGGVTIENARLGYLETDWVEQRYNLGQSAIGRALASMHSTGLRDKFRVRIEPGRQPGTTEVMVSHLGLEQLSLGAGAVGPELLWQPRKSDPVLEADLLDRMLAALGAVDPTTRPPLTAEQMPAVKRAARPKGPLVLAGETGDSAWRKVSQALDRAGIQIEDRDRGSGLLFVRYREQEANQQKSGLTTWIFGSRKKASDVDDGQDRYQVRLKPDKNGVIVEVLNVEGVDDSLDPVPARLLDTLYEQLL